MKKFNVLYQGRKIYTNLTAEDCSEILQDFSERFYSGEDIDLESLELEEIYG
jgi:broad-specificity NMP kinase